MTADCISLKVWLNRFRDEIHALAKSKHWHDEDASNDRAYLARSTANLHAEISELWESYRNGKLNSQCDKPIPLTFMEEEMADVLIRLLDMAARLKVDIGSAAVVKHEFNKTRPDRHGGKLA